MARYNTSSVKTIKEVTNFEGGTSYSLKPKYELVSLMVSGLDNTFYEKLGERETRFRELITKLAKTDLEFVAKALIYTRSEVGQRSVTHFGSTVLAPFLSGTELGKKFYGKRNRTTKTGGIIYRLDDMLEIVACYMTLNPNKPLPNSMKKGFKDALETADTYELAKYQGKGKAVSLVDLVNLVHPKPSKEMVETFSKLMKGELKEFNTVESKNSETGQVVAARLKSGEITKEEANTQLQESKESNYRDLITSKKIGYLALLRNLRNILKNSSDADLINGATNLLMNEAFIRKSLVFPHQIDLALEVILDEFGTSSTSVRSMITALNTAYELSIPNLTELFTHGKTAVVFDTSASMTNKVTLSAGRKNGSDSCIGKAALVAATLSKGINADVYHFASYCEGVKFNPLDSVNTIKNQFVKMEGRVGHGTDFNSIFTTLKGNYDRVFVISDMQGASRITPTSYSKMHIYSIDMAGYGTSMFKAGNNIYSINGYGSDIYELVKKVEINPQVLIDEIEAIQI
jgi:60 kDa SS-A/Ro ribonucleoprotein